MSWDDRDLALILIRKTDDGYRTSDSQNFENLGGAVNHERWWLNQNISEDNAKQLNPSSDGNICIKKIYNKGVFWNEEVNAMVTDVLSKRYIVIPTSHLHDKIRMKRLPFSCYKTALFGEVVECEVVNSEVTKIITRVNNRYNPQKDMCFAVLVQYPYAIIKTVWENNSDDKHETIRRARCEYK